MGLISSLRHPSIHLLTTVTLLSARLVKEYADFLTYKILNNFMYHRRYVTRQVGLMLSLCNSILDMSAPNLTQVAGDPHSA